LINDHKPKRRVEVFHEGKVDFLNLAHFFKVLHVNLDLLPDLERALVNVKRIKDIVKHLLDSLLLVISSLHFRCNASKHERIQKCTKNDDDDTKVSLSLRLWHDVVTSQKQD
jgi:allantoicase